MKKLLNKTILPFALFSLLLLAVSVPFYYFLINDIWLEELDEHHWVTRNKIEKELNTRYEAGENIGEIVDQFNRLSLRTKISPAPTQAMRNDSVYSQYRFDPYYEEVERFRGLTTQININGKNYHLIVETNIEESDETIFTIASVTLVFFILLLSGIFFLNRRLSKKLWEPFYITLDKLRTFDLSSEKKIVFGKTRILEFEELNAALDKLITQNISIFKQQKEFTENASHELQTPLAILKSKIDLLLQDDSLTGNQSERIATLNIPLSRASRINKNLLLLAKIENQKFAEDKEELSVNEMIKESLTFIAVQQESKGFTMVKNFTGTISVKANKSLLEMVVLNILLNATRHTDENGLLDIQLTNEKLTVSNSGTEALKAHSLFKRFVSSSQSTPGSGLGLAIVKEICNRYNWQVTYSFENNMHIFSVVF